MAKSGNDVHALQDSAGEVQVRSCLGCRFIAKIIVNGSDKFIGVVFKICARIAGQAVRFAPESTKARRDRTHDEEKSAEKSASVMWISGYDTDCHA